MLETALGQLQRWRRDDARGARPVDGGQPVAAAAHRSRPDPQGRPGPCRDRGSPGEPAPGDHRDRSHELRGRLDLDARRPAPAGRAPDHRRLRDRLLVAGAAQEAARDRAEDRPFLRRRAGPGLLGPVDRRRHHQHGRLAGPRGDRRGRGDRRAARDPAVARRRDGPGLPVVAGAARPPAWPTGCGRCPCTRSSPRFATC